MDHLGAHVALRVIVGVVYLLPARNKLEQHLVSENQKVEEVDGYRKP